MNSIITDVKFKLGMETSKLIDVVPGGCITTMSVNLWMGYCKQILIDVWWWMDLH